MIEEAEKESNRIDQKIHEGRNLISSLKRHAKTHGIKITEEEKS